VRNSDGQSVHADCSWETSQKLLVEIRCSSTVKRSKGRHGPFDTTNKTLNPKDRSTGAKKGCSPPSQEKHDRCQKSAPYECYAESHLRASLDLEGPDKWQKAPETVKEVLLKPKNEDAEGRYLTVCSSSHGFCPSTNMRWNI
jgi:hypothetical protein